jgi:hypothetical protein
LPADPHKYLYCENPQPRLLALRQRFLSGADLERPRQGFAARASLELEMAGGQQQLFLCKDSMAVIDAQVMKQIYSALSALQPQ